MCVHAYNPTRQDLADLLPFQEFDGTCAAMSRVFDFKPGMGQEEANKYRYIFDMGK